MIEKCLFIILLARYSHSIRVPVTGQVTVTTTHGSVIGNGFKLPDESIGARFLGIPYAKPPTGPLRFKKPEDKTPWSTPFMASKYGKSCLTHDIWNEKTMAFNNSRYYLTTKVEEVDEDCLTLNIFTKLNTQNHFDSISKKLPVMVFIHGGSFTTGGSSLYSPEKLASTGLVVVTINYRIGVLGFLSTGDKHARGNWGMLDQVLALKFVKKNIAAFGGDANKVLIAGHSAGGEAANLHSYSPLSKGLFNRVAAMSGTISHLSMQKDPLKNARELAKHVNCTQKRNEKVANTIKAMVECLRKVPFSSYPKEYSFMQRPDYGIKFAPVVEGVHDGAFLPTDPFQATPIDTSINVFVTYTQHEFPQLTPKLKPFTGAGSHIVTSYDQLTKDVEKKIANTTVDTLKSFIHQCWENIVSQKMIKKYIKEFSTLLFYENGTTVIVSLVPKENLDEYKVLSDIFFKFPAIAEANRLSKSSTVYVGEYDYKSKSDAFLKPNYIGAYHGSELLYLFGYPFYNLENGLKEPLDEKYSTQIMEMFRKFADTGVPTLGSINTWRPYSGKWDSIMRIAPKGYLPNKKSITQTRDFESRFKFWSKVMSGKFNNNKRCKKTKNFLDVQ